MAGDPPARLGLHHNHRRSVTPPPTGILSRSGPIQMLTKDSSSLLARSPIRLSCKRYAAVTIYIGGKNVSPLFSRECLRARYGTLDPLLRRSGLQKSSGFYSWRRQTEYWRGVGSRGQNAARRF